MKKNPILTKERSHAKTKLLRHKRTARRQEIRLVSKRFLFNNNFRDCRHRKNKLVYDLPSNDRFFFAPLRLCVRNLLEIVPLQTPVSSVVYFFLCVFARGLCSIIFSAFLFTGCSTMVHKGGELLEGTHAGESNLAVYKSVRDRSVRKKDEIKIELREIAQKDGNVFVEISSSKWPGLALRGEKPGGSGNFDLYEANILSSHENGWNEFNLDILGRAVFSDPKRSGGILYIPGNAERIQISSGRIRLKSSRLSGEAALSPLKNRRERILALIEWMNGWLLENQKSVNLLNQRDFKEFWEPLLFPEMVSKRKRPSEYSTQNSEWQRADSIKWNLSYTDYLFPEELRELRNSGALLRDWEEALPWIFTEYSWDYIISSFNNIELKKVK